MLYCGIIVTNCTNTLVYYNTTMTKYIFRMFYYTMSVAVLITFPLLQRHNRTKANLHK